MRVESWPNKSLCSLRGSSVMRKANASGIPAHAESARSNKLLVDELAVAFMVPAPAVR